MRNRLSPSGSRLRQGTGANVQSVLAPSKRLQFGRKGSGHIGIGILQILALLHDSLDGAVVCRPHVDTVLADGMGGTHSPEEC